MKKCLAALVVLLLAGCGGSAFTDGTYAGSLTQSSTCSDGSGASQTGQFSWALSQSGSTLTITDTGSCSPMTAAISGAAATLNQKNCGTQAISGGTETFSITGGTVTANGDKLQVASNSSATLNFSNGSSGNCTGTLVGTLTKQ